MSDTRDDQELIRRWQDSKASMAETEAKIRDLERFVAQARAGVQETLRLEAERAMFSAFDPDAVQEFFREPYVTIPRRPQEWYVVAPRFVKFQIGWLEKTTRSYYVFLVNKFMHWLAQVPESLKGQFDFKPELPVQVVDGVVLTGAHQDEVVSRYGQHLGNRVGSDKVRVKQGCEFALIANMINDGTLPFQPRPVAAEHLRQPTWGPTPIELRPYQDAAWKKFLEFGAIGVFWPFSAGKTFLGLWAIAHLSGPHLVVVPTRTLKEQWSDRILQHLSWRDRQDVHVVTYNGYDKVRDKSWRLAIFDEAHRLPANTFSRLATIRSAYRVGLSGTPYREDGRTGYIFALTGFPVGMDWHELLELGVFKMPAVTVYTFSDQAGKLRKLETLLRDPVKTIVFCDSIDLGSRIASRFSLPHVHGGTSRRMETLTKAPVSVVSRVGDEGISLPDIRRVIEIDFLFGSRRQEAQRMGRLFHSRSDKAGEHFILMTDHELAAHEKRLYAAYEKGFKVEILRG